MAGPRACPTGPWPRPPSARSGSGPRRAGCPRGALGPDTHRALGLAVLLLGARRLGGRAASGFPAPAAPGPSWQEAAAKGTRWALLAARVLMPLSGALTTMAAGRALDLRGLVVLPARAEIPWLQAASEALHEAAWPVLPVPSALHDGAALEHHVTGRDATLVRTIAGRTLR